MATAPDMSTIEWRVSEGLTDYEGAVTEMEARAIAIREGTASEMIWLLEHPPLITAGTSAPPEELIAPDRFPVFKSGRGGRHTYHGPGQRVGYLLLDLDKRGRDVRAFVEALEGWLIAALARIGITARTAEGRIGIWVDTPDGQEAKIGAIGIRVKRWVSFHGFAVNIAPSLDHFGAIVPCGLPDFPVTSVAALGRPADMKRFDDALAAEFGHFLDTLQPAR